MTRTARRFVGPLTFEAITRERVITSAVRAGHERGHRAHRARLRASTCCSWRPATANIIGKFAQRHRRRFPVGAVSGDTAPVLLAPAMNTNMWEHPADGGERSRRCGARRALRRSGRRLSGVRLGGQGPAGRAGSDRRGRRAHRCMPQTTSRRQDACSSPRDRRSKISIPCASSATDRAAAWASRSRGSRAPRRDGDARRRTDRARRRRPFRSRARSQRREMHAAVMAAAPIGGRRHHGRGRRRLHAGRRAPRLDKIEKGGPLTIDLERTRRHPRGARRVARRPRPTGARRICRADGRSRARGAPQAAGARASTSSSRTT